MELTFCNICCVQTFFLSICCLLRTHIDIICAGTRERKAEPIPEEDLLSCKLRPAFADGLQRVLSKDMLQSVGGLNIFTIDDNA
eukprot:1152060-Pelagomonas_calceolata.AAC.4